MDLHFSKIGTDHKRFEETLMQTDNPEVGGFTRSATLVLAALIWPAAVSAQQNMKACNLLTPAELSAGIGGSVGHATGIFSPKNSYRAGDFWSCEQTVGSRTVRIFCNTLAVTEEAKRLAQEQRERYGRQGYQIQEREFGSARCATTVLQAGAKDTFEVLGTSCERQKGPYHVIVAVGTTGPNDIVPMENVASLVEKAASRVPAQ
jgi:hypothetical protein